MTKTFAITSQRVNVSGYQNDKLASIGWGANGQPKSTAFDDIYFSAVNGYEESRHVFLNANNLLQRWQSITESQFSIGETGFGTGLNFLVAWQAWRADRQHEERQLHFFSVEKYPLSRDDLARSLQLWPDLGELSGQLIEAYPPQPLTGWHRVRFDNDRVTLTVFFGEAADGLEQIAPIIRAAPHVSELQCSYGNIKPKIDAWFLDGFAPAKNPDMWSPRLFAALKQLSGVGTTFSTFTAASAVKKQLELNDFSYQKIKGFGKKREMLVGSFNAKHETAIVPEPATSHFHSGHPRKEAVEPTWHLVNAHTTKSIASCTVIGGGLAGCHTARALADKNIQVTLIEKASSLATAASGNRQAVLYAKLSPHQDALSRFNLSALLFANNIYQNHRYYESSGDQCGVFHMGVTEKQAQRFRDVCDRFKHDPQFIRWIDKSDTKHITGVSLNQGGMFIPKAGWLKPADLCRQLVQHPNIHVIPDTTIGALEYAQQQWSIFDSTRRCVLQSDAVVIANANDARRLQQSEHLPLRPIRGQVSHAAPVRSSAELKSVICGEGYITPAHEKLHTFGATFTLKDNQDAITTEDHAINLHNIQTLSNEFNGLHIDQTNPGRVGFRCTTPDYFPIVGPVADHEEMIETFQFLRKKANAIIDAPGKYHPNLYCNLGHGSRGLCYAPLSAEVLASIITGQFPPMSRELYRHIHPARFIIRDLIRNKI